MRTGATTRARARASRALDVVLDADCLLHVAKHIQCLRGIIGLTFASHSLYTVLHPRLNDLLPPISRPSGVVVTEPDNPWLPPGVWMLNVPSGNPMVPAKKKLEKLLSICSTDGSLHQVREALAGDARGSGAQVNGSLPELYELTALGYACKRARPMLVRLLLQNGADPNGIDSDGRRPLHCCSGIGYESQFRGHRRECARLLLGAGADCSLRSLRRITAHPTSKIGPPYQWTELQTPLEYARARLAKDPDDEAADVVKVLESPPTRWRVPPREPLVTA